MPSRPRGVSEVRTSRPPTVMLGVGCAGSLASVRAAHAQEGPDHRHHRPGRLLPGRAAAREGLRGPRHRPPLLELQHRPASTTSTTTRTSTGVRLFTHYGDLADSVSLTQLLYELQPDEIYHLGAQSHVRVSFDIPEYTVDVTGAGTLRLLEAIRESGVTARFYQASSSEMFGVRAAAADRDHAVPSAQPLRGRQGGRVLGHGQLPRGVRHVRRQRHPLQPRVAPPRRDLRDAQDHPRRWRASRRACRTSSTSATSTRSATGASPATTSRRCG